MSNKQEIKDLKNDIQLLKDRIINLERKEYLRLNPFKYNIHDKVKAKIVKTVFGYFEDNCIVIDRYIKFDNTQGYIKNYEVSTECGFKTNVSEEYIVDKVDNSVKKSKKQSCKTR